MQGKAGEEKDDIYTEVGWIWIQQSDTTSDWREEEIGNWIRITRLCTSQWNGPSGQERGKLCVGKSAREKNKEKVWAK